MQGTPILSGCPYIAGGKKHFTVSLPHHVFMFFSENKMITDHILAKKDRDGKLVHSNTVWYP